MDYDFGIFEKAKEIYNALWKLSWFTVPIVGLITFVSWLLTDYLPARALQMLETLRALVPNVSLNIASVGIDWPRINQWVPVNEAFTFGAVYLGLAGALIFFKLLRKMIPVG